MLQVLVSRAGQTLAVLLAISAMAFVTFRYVGDPVSLMVREDASPAEKQQLRERLGLDQPIYVQYGRFIARVTQGDLGISYRNQRPVSEMLVERFPATFELVLVATVMALGIGIPLGVYCALHPSGVLSRVFQLLSLLGMSIPAFVVGIVLIMIFSVHFKVLPSFGRGATVQIGWWSTGFLTPSGWRSLILPAISLALYQLTLIMRLVKSEMTDVLMTDYIRYARARGLPARYIHFKLALRNALMPAITVTGLQVGSLIAFAIVTETVFQWPGMGLLFIQAVTNVDLSVMAAYLLLVGVIFVIINIVVDILYVIVDPRLRQTAS
jgi:peptide/nickel transport system permease protein